jgi:spore maturation protein CgeB
MTILFIGQCGYGSTSHMRFEMIQKYFDCSVQLINTSPIIEDTWKPYRSIGWRFQRGPLVESINKTILNGFDVKKNYDLIWIEKGVFIKESTLRQLKMVSKKLVHFTPDPAFLYHKSRHFTKGLKHYDFCITTKSFELGLYKNKGAKNVIYCTQGYDEDLHKPMVPFEDKIYDICFIGHHEQERELVLSQLLQVGFSIALAGIKWKSFVKRNRQKKNLHYFGKHVAGENYTLLISQSKLGLGLLSKWIPEKHTTRTMEIPACGTILVTEKNEETEFMFRESDVIFFSDIDSISNQIAQILKNPAELKLKTKLGREAILSGDFSHRKIVEKVLDKIQDEKVN